MTEKDAETILLELQLLRREVAGIRIEILRRKMSATKAGRSRMKMVSAVAKKHPVSELDIARALKRFRK